MCIEEPIILDEPFLEEVYETKMEMIEMPDGTWQVIEKHIYTYTNPLEARNKIESYIYNKMNKRGK